MSVGSCIQQLRLDKSLSPKQVYMDIVTRSHYWKIEHGQSDPSASVLLQILERLNVTNQEFIEMVDGNYRNYKQLKERFRIAVEQKDTAHLTEIERLTRSSFSETHNIKFHHLGCLCALFLYNLDARPFPEDEAQQIRNYIFSAPSWGEYEISLLNNSLFIFPQDSLLTLTNKALKFFEHKYLDTDVEKRTMKLVQNIICYSLYKSERKDLQAVLAPIDMSTFASDSMYARAVYKWLEGLLLAKLDKDEEGIKMMYEVVHMFDYLSMDSEAKLFRNYMTRFDVDVTAKKKS